MNEHLPIGPARRCPACVARQRAARTDAEPLGWWRQSVGEAATLLLMGALIVAMFATLILVGGGLGGRSS